jgi:Spy/CpxP family protein refolding chaperone
MGGGGMMGGSGGGHGAGMMGGNGMGSRNDNGYRPDTNGYGPGTDGYGPRTNGARRDAPLVPDANRSAPSGDLDLGPLDQLDLSRQQIGAIKIIREELRDRQSNTKRRLEAEQEKLRDLYDSPDRDQSKIDSQFERIGKLRRELFESSVNAHDRVEAQLNAQQLKHLRRIAPRWSAAG